MESINEIFLKAIEFFPRWMNIRRRPYKSNEGNLLSSIIDEYNNVRIAIQKYEKDFFLVNFFGKEDEILETLYTAHIGTIDNFTKLDIQNYDLTLTTDIDTFQKNTTTLYYQDGYILVRPRFIDKDHMYLNYTYNDYPYSIKWVKMHVWNIFDEFAWFAGLERFDDETNKELCDRTIAAFKNRTNVTEQGLKNAIINIASDILSKATVTMEQPNVKNMALPDSDFGTTFERLAQENKDLARTKVWNITYWQNSFKTMEYLPHIWDAQVKLYQDGVGYNDSLKIHLSNELTSIGSTDVSVTAYRKSKRAIEQYIQKNMIQKQLTLSLKRYKNILTTTKLQYRILASTVKKLDPSAITFYGYQTSTNTEKQYLSDIILDKQNVTEINNNTLDKNTKYKLLFYPDGPKDSNGNHYGTMQISKCNLTTGSTTKSLLKASGSFSVYNGIFQNKDVKFFTDTIKNLTSYENVKDTDNGMTVSDISKPGRFVIDVSNAGNNYVVIPFKCQKIDYTTNSQFVSMTNHFSYNNDIIEDVYNDTNSTVTIDIPSVKDFSFDLLKESDASKQGTIHIVVIEPNKQYSKDMTNAGTFSLSYDVPTDIKLIIQKTGMNPVRISNIEASRVGFNITAKDNNDKDITVIHTPFGTLVPTNAKELIIELQAYSNTLPYIDYIHIGPELDNSSVYTIDDIQGDFLDIDTNCRVVLLNKSTGKMTDNYITKSLYKNDTNDTGIIYIDTSKYTQIDYSSSKIYTDTNTGDSYITLSPGNTISYIKIKGTAKKLIYTRTLVDILEAQKINGYDCYVSRNLPEIILYNKNSETLFKLYKSYLESSCDTYHIAINDNTVSPIFVQDSTHSKISNDTNEPFNYISFYPSEYQEYVAYNSVTMYQQEMSGVPIAYNFSPLLSQTAFVLFQITDIPKNTTIEFVKQNGSASWSLGRKAQGIHIKIPVDQENQKNYQTEIKQLQETFVISNSIPLQDSYNINGEDTNLSEYIIVPPDKMQVDYQTKAAVDDVRIENDGFTKLLYSNIDKILSVSVNNVTLDSSKYTLLAQAGILIWNDKDLYGKIAQVTYQYEKPYALSFISLDDLYDVVGYTVDAYEAINDEPDIYENKKDGDVFTVSYPGADHLTLSCSNEGFMALSSKDNSTISVYKITQDNVVVAHNGYLYDQGKEYWMFADRHEDTENRYDGVTFENVHKIPGKLLFDIESTNHIINSSMETSYLDTLCVVDFLTNKHIPEISKLESLTPCDSFNGWFGFFMDVTLKESGVGYDLVFTPKEDYGYAVLEVTDYVSDNDAIDIQETGDADIYLCKDILINNMYVRKAVFAEPYESFKDNKITITDYDSKARYFILISGKKGTTITISEIVIANKPIDDIHTKNIDKFGYTITETRDKGTNVPLRFTPSFSREDNIEFDRKNELMLGMTTDYGLTLLNNIDFDECQINRITYLKNIFQTGNESGTILTPVIELDNYQALKAMDVRINNILFDDTYKNFDIKVLTSDTYDGTFTEVFDEDDVNSIIVSRRYLKKYIRLQITMPADSIIDSIAVFAEYYEDNVAPHVRYHTKGTMTTKLFDTCSTGDYRLVSIQASRVHKKDAIYFEIRGCREDERALEWTDWYPVKTDDNFNVTSENIFRGYRLFQVRVTIEDKDSRILLDGITMRTV